MNNLIKINYGNADHPTVSGRELHEALGVKTAYKDWFPRMCEYGFSEGKDFSSILSESTGGRPSTEHAITIPMAKELCMLQRTDKGKEMRRYFIAVEEQWNTPEAVMARAIRMADMEIKRLETQCYQLETTVVVQEQQIKELKPKADYTDKILQNKGLVTITQIAKDYGMSGNKLNEKLHELGVQYKLSSQWLLYAKYQDKGYTHSETVNITRSDGRPDIKMNTKWTQKGRLFLYNLLKANGILPIIERDEKTAPIVA